MTKRYLLLTPLTAKALQMPLERILHVAHLGGMQAEHSLSTQGDTCIYISSTNLDALADFCDKNQLEGKCLEYTAVYNMQITLE